MASLYTHQSSNVAKTWALMTAFFLLIIAVGWFVSYYFGNQFILYIAVGIALAMNVTAYWFSDKVALRSAHAKEADSVKYLELHRIVENLAITAGLPKPRVYIIEDPAPNAFAAGRDPKHALVAVTTGLLERLDRSELEGVIAHELAHIGNRDILVMTVAVVLAGVLTVIADIFLRMTFFGGGNRDRNVHPLVMVLGIVGVILAPIAAQMIHLAISRKREFLADASGALLTRYPDGLASALRKISSYSNPVQHATHATAHLYISNPFGASGRGKTGNFVNKLFSTHPPIEERIAALTGMRV
jgi:heat shock protein HtpX